MFVQVAFQQADFAGWNLWAAINDRPLLPFRFVIYILLFVIQLNGNYDFDKRKKRKTKFICLFFRFQNLGEMMVLGKSDAAVTPSFIEGFTLDGPIGHAGNSFILIFVVIYCLNNFPISIFLFFYFSFLFLFQQGNLRTY